MNPKALGAIRGLSLISRSPVRWHRFFVKILDFLEFYGIIVGAEDLAYIGAIIACHSNLVCCYGVTQQVQKGESMDENMNVGEVFREVTEENQTRKILEMVRDCKDLNEAIEKISALLNK